MYTVKQLADLAGVSVHTLHDYDEIDLLAPDTIGANGYRYYSADSLLRLQQILFFRALDFRIDEIKAILDQPGFDLLRALQKHRVALKEKSAQLDQLIQTVDKTIARLKGEAQVSEKELFEGFDEAKQEEYAAEAWRRWGSQDVDDSMKRWGKYSKARHAEIIAEGEAIRRDLAAQINQRFDSAAVQQIVARWHQNMKNFYEPSIERLRGLGQLYVDDSAFRANYAKLDPRLPEFFRDAIVEYCKNKS